MKQQFTKFALILAGFAFTSLPLTAQEEIETEVEEVNEATEGVKITFEKDSKSTKKKKGRTSHYGSIDLGMNNYLENGKFPDENASAYTIKPLGSWFVALNSTNDTRISNTLHLQWGGGISWYNFKLQNENVRFIKNDDAITFEEDNRAIYPIKSKLTASYLNAQIVPMLSFGKKNEVKNSCWNRKDKKGFRIGLGVFGGYRLGSHSKFVFNEEGDREKEKDRSNFFLNNWRYGTRLQIGHNNTNLFINYDLNELFAEGKGPKLNAFSFGVVL